MGTNGKAGPGRHYFFSIKYDRQGKPKTSVLDEPHVLLKKLHQIFFSLGIKRNKSDLIKKISANNIEHILFSLPDMGILTVEINRAMICFRFSIVTHELTPEKTYHEFLETFVELDRKRFSLHDHNYDKIVEGRIQSIA